MHLQSLIVALLVIGCSSYAVWTLMPSAARRALASWLLRLPLPARLAARLQRTAQAASGCGCDGCDRSELGKTSKSSAPAETAQPLKFHPRPRR